MGVVFGSSSCAIHPSGWVTLKSGASITRLSLWDPANEIFCRKGFVEAPAMLATWGMRLPTWQELEELDKLATYIAPFPLPTAAMLTAAGIPLSNQSAIDSYRNANMTSLEWAQIHDREVFARLSKAGWNGEPVFNDGKHMTQGGGIYGWRQPNGTLIQGLSYAHKGTDHRDYATTIHAVAGAAPPAPPKGDLYPPGVASSSARGAVAGVGVSLLASAAAAAVWYWT
jgi:hypothetical protein